MTMKEAVRQAALRLGFDDCRFTSAAPPDHAADFLGWLRSKRHGAMAWLERNAHKRVQPNEVLHEARTIICLGVSYHRPGAPSSGSFSPRNTGVIARYARFRDYHDALAGPLKQLAEFVNAQGDAPSKSLWYVDTGPFLEKDLARRAGLGFTGKHTNLIHRRWGNWMFLSEIITTLELEPDDPEPNRCGKCSRCLDACPTGAFPGPFQLDARKCISYLTIELKGPIPESMRRAVGTRVFGCDDCLEVCPWNRFAQEGRLMKSQAREDLDQPELLELLGLDAEGFRRRFKGTPIFRAKRRGLLRNVCVALGNAGDPSALEALKHAANDPEELIAEHAAWAMREIRSRFNLPG